MYFLKFLIFLAWVILSADGKNIVLIIADDLDYVLDGMTPLAFTKKLIADEGVTFTNAFAAVPICCPNRASILTGRYQHNHKVFNNTMEGGCNSQEWRTNFEGNTFAAILKEQMNYNTFYAGKYLNKYGSKPDGVRHIPRGWKNWYGLVGNSKYYDYSLSVNGAEKKYGVNQNDYLTDVINNFGVEFIKNQGQQQPFLMVLAPPAPHEPFIPAARHRDKYKGTKAKRTKNFNTYIQKDKHWLVRMGISPLPTSVITKLDDIYRRRWESLLAVDELVKNVYTTLQARQLLNDTYIIFTSDNGFHIGQFSMPYDKRQPYETDIRIPLMMRGPLLPRTKVKAAVSSVDLFATILQIAGVEKPSDGMSLLDMIDDGTALHQQVKDRLVLVEYTGEGSEGRPMSGCPSDSDPKVSHCNKDYACKCQDVRNNTFSCVRRAAKDYNNVFCLFKDDEDFIEYYDLNKDEFQMENLSPSMGRSLRYRFRKRVKKMMTCKDTTCIATNPPIKIH